MSAATTALLVGAAVLGVGVPWFGIRMIAPTLRSSEGAHATNFHGRPVFYGLGIVWLLWAGCAVIAGVAFASMTGNTVLPILTLAGPLALVAFALGFIDDAYGSDAARGFKGHLTAMFKGQLTTGGMKLVGIGLASLVVAVMMGQVSPWGSFAQADGFSAVIRGGAILLAGASVALTSNLFNLLDLRPGRALKAYGLLIPVAVVSAAVGLGHGPGVEWLGVRGVGPVAFDAAALLLFLIGPMAAVWRFDLGEVGMLGDAGANPMGATIGLLIISGLPLWGLIVWTLFVLAANLASERVSFSAVIAKNALLRRIDGLGRLEEDATPRDDKGARF